LNSLIPISIYSFNSQDSPTRYPFLTLLYRWSDYILKGQCLQGYTSIKQQTEVLHSGVPDFEAFLLHQCTILPSTRSLGAEAFKIEQEIVIIIPQCLWNGILSWYHKVLHYFIGIWLFGFHLNHFKCMVKNHGHLLNCQKSLLSKN
jgi:hypothetical protein